MTDLKAALTKAVDELHKLGGELPPALAERAAKVGLTIKGRDPREPGLRKKNRMERRMQELLTRRLQKQLAALREHLTAMNPDRKALSAGGIIIQTDDIDAELLLLFVQAIREGIGIFDETIPLDVDFSSANLRALEYAREYVTKWLQGLDETSANAVREAVQNFIDNPGTTIRDTIELLAPTFGETRAERIAVTEITRAYAEGNQLAAVDMAEQWPGVKVTKRWFTNNDDLVCPICGPLEGKEVDYNEDFGDGIENPPAHVNCRCWTSTGTVIE